MAMKAKRVFDKVNKVMTKSIRFERASIHARVIIIRQWYRPAIIKINFMKFQEEPLLIDNFQFMFHRRLYSKNSYSGVRIPRIIRSRRT